MGSSVLLIPFVLILRLHRRSPLHLSCLFPSLSILSLFSISVPRTTLLYTRISLSILSFRLLRFSLPGSLPLVSIPSRCPLEEGSEGISFSADKSLASLPNIDSRSNLRRDPSPSLPSVALSLSHSFAWLVSLHRYYSLFVVPFAHLSRRRLLRRRQNKPPISSWYK